MSYRQNPEFDDYRLEFIIDGAPSHKSEVSKIIMKHLGVNMIILPPYTPEFAPVELVFGSLKDAMITRYRDRMLDYNKEEAQDLVSNEIETLTPCYLLRCFFHCQDQERATLFGKTPLKE